MTLQGLNHRHNSVMAPDSKVVALGDIVSEYDSRTLTDSREDCQKDPSLQGLGLIDNNE